MKKTEMTDETRKMLRQITGGSCEGILATKECPIYATVRSCEQCNIIGHYSANLPAPIRAKAAAMLEEATTETDNKMRIEERGLYVNKHDNRIYTILEMSKTGLSVKGYDIRLPSFFIPIDEFRQHYVGLHTVPFNSPPHPTPPPPQSQRPKGTKEEETPILINGDEFLAHLAKNNLVMYVKDNILFVKPKPNTPATPTPPLSKVTVERLRLYTDDKTWQCCHDNLRGLHYRRLEPKGLPTLSQEAATALIRSATVEALNEMRYEGQSDWFYCTTYNRYESHNDIIVIESQSQADALIAKYTTVPLSKVTVERLNRYRCEGRSDWLYEIYTDTKRTAYFHSNDNSYVLFQDVADALIRSATVEALNEMKHDGYSDWVYFEGHYANKFRFSNSKAYTQSEADSIIEEADGKRESYITVDVDPIKPHITYTLQYKHGESAEPSYRAIINQLIEKCCDVFKTNQTELDNAVRLAKDVVKLKSMLESNKTGNARMRLKILNQRQALSDLQRAHNKLLTDLGEK